MLKILIKNGRIIDGSGGPAFNGHLGVSGERIVLLDRATEVPGELPAAETVIDAEENLVCPGFVDAHSHSDAYLLIEPSSPSKIYQGITTEITGNCGASAAPLEGSYEMPSDWRARKYPGTWRTVAEYRKLLENMRPAPNVVFLAGHRALRVGVIGSEHRRASRNELEKMKLRLRRAMDEGARGFSTGLIYAPAMCAAPEEIIELARTAAQYGGIYTTHMRSEGEHLPAALDETIDVARQSGVRVEISHLKVAGRSNWHLIDRALEKIRKAREECIPVAADRYPYTSSFTELDVVFPDWAQEGGAQAMLQRLRDHSARMKISRELASSRPPDYWNTVILGSAWCREYSPFQGKPISESAQLMGLSPVDAVLRLVEAGKGRTCAFFSGMSDENMLRILAEPCVMLGTDASLRAPWGPLGDDYPHPRTYGSFPRFLGMALEGRTVSIEEAVRKMTSLPCEHFRLHKRGLLKRGYAADIVVIDPATVKDTASYEKPHSLAKGLKYAIINGVVTFSRGNLTGKRGGAWL